MTSFAFPVLMSRHPARPDSEFARQTARHTSESRQLKMSRRALRRHPHLLAKIATLIACSAVAVYTVELLLYWDPLEFLGPKPRRGFDLRGWFEVARDLRAQDASAYPVVGVKMWLASPPELEGALVVPLSGVPHTTTVMCNESGSYVTYQSDRFGFNAPDWQWELRPEVALVGDSFVEGWCVPREDSFAGVIRRAIPATLNVGYTGHGPLAELGAIREYVASRRPAHVFWFFYEGNDLVEDLPRELTSSILRRYLEPEFTQQLERKADALGDEIRRLLDVRLTNSQESSPADPLHDIAKLRWSRRLVNTAVAKIERSASPHPPLAELGQILAEARRTVAEWGGSFHFVYLPDLPSVLGEGDSAAHDRVIRLAAGLGLSIIDLSANFKNHSSPLSLFPYEEGRHLVKRVGLHYNRNGHRLVADRILQAVEGDLVEQHLQH
jgi:hypothetical protein